MKTTLTRLAAIWALFALLSPARAAQGEQQVAYLPPPGAIPAVVVEVYDGDTVTVDAYPWPGLTVRTSVRLDGIDTPEIRGKCEAEKEAAQAARDRLQELLGTSVTLTDVREGKYAGRVVARIMLSDGRDATTVLLNEGLGRPYDGKARQGWCAGPS
ncbi:thermonuclease family protein [Pararhodospirillum oryzae]|uniref:TNase-like domain-containing protein n=1 Tax=Pararhodospirillum oryzae TaxID=478448 RepID=A0A512H673_9PROT|nr:thermonuclease family protein [Pararhodospirillum oryzae]GEO80943.1 hypothetical protein ROR02_10740 [Pararhodospirillum oryzae]